MFTNLEIILGIFISVIGVYLAYRSLVLKVGRMRIRGTYTVTSSIACDDKYISTVTLENVRDRAVTIFTIYLKFGHDLYVEIGDFNDKPLILGPFETFRKEYDPINFYSVGMRRILINELFDDMKLKKRLVLSTSDGKHTIRRMIPTWSPVIEFFRNYTTGIVQPIRSTYKGKAYGSSTLYLIELTLSDETNQVLPIYPRDHEVKRFRRFQLTPESLESKESLESFLNLQKDQGTLPVASVTVHDLRASREERFEKNSKDPIKVKPAGFFKYYVIGWVLTRISNWDTRRKNKLRARGRGQQHAGQISSEASPSASPDEPSA